MIEKQIKIMLIDDHPVLRSSLRLLINSQQDMCVSAETAESAEAIALCRSNQPDIVLLDLSLQGSNGIDLLKVLKSSYPDIKVLVLTMHDDDAYLPEIMRLGGSGYLRKKSVDEALLPAIRSLFLHS